MNWRARLVRFRAPEKSQRKTGGDRTRFGETAQQDIKEFGGMSEATTATKACERARQGSRCKQADESVSLLSKLLIH